jgi:hypothetical protein
VIPNKEIPVYKEADQDRDAPVVRSSSLPDVAGSMLQEGVCPATSTSLEQRVAGIARVALLIFASLVLAAELVMFVINAWIPKTSPTGIGGGVVMMAVAIRALYVLSGLNDRTRGSP